MSANLERRERIRQIIDRVLREHKRYPSVREVAKAEGITVSNAWRYIKRAKEGYRRRNKP